MNKYLIVIDVQKDFVDGALGTPEALAIIPRIREKIAKYRKGGWNIIFTRDTHQSDYLDTAEGKNLPVKHCIQGTDGWKIYGDLATEGACVVNKPTFGYLDWSAHIKNSNELEIELVGLCTDICVISNALILKALYPEAKIAVDALACAGVTPASHTAALTAMKMCQIEIR